METTGLPGSLCRLSVIPTRDCRVIGNAALGVTTRSVKNRTLSRQSNEISWLKSKAFAYRGGLLGTRHRNFPFQPLPDTAARGGTDEPNLLACSFEPTKPANSNPKIAAMAVTMTVIQIARC